MKSLLALIVGVSASVTSYAQGPSNFGAPAGPAVPTAPIWPSIPPSPKTAPTPAAPAAPRIPASTTAPATPPPRAVPPVPAAPSAPGLVAVPPPPGASATKPNPNPSTPLDFKNVGRGISVRLDARESATTRIISHSNYGGSDRDHSRGKSLAIDLTNVSRTAWPSGTSLDVIWFAQGVRDKSVGVFHHSSTALTVAPGTSTKESVDMPTMQSTTYGSSYYGYNWGSGTKVFGWLVLVRVQDQVAAIRASNATIEQYTHDGSLQKMLEQYESYSSNQRQFGGGGGRGGFFGN